MSDHIKSELYFPFRMILLGISTYAVGAVAVCLLYLAVAIKIGFGKEIKGVLFLLVMGTVGAYIGGFLLSRFLRNHMIGNRRGAFGFGALSALLEASGITIGAILLFFVMAAEAKVSGLTELLVFSIIGLFGITVLNAAHGAVIAGYLFREKPRVYFALVSAGMAMASGVVFGLPYLWVMSGLPMSYRGIEYQMLVPVLITVISLGMTTGVCLGIYCKGKAS